MNHFPGEAGQFGSPALPLVPFPSAKPKFTRRRFIEGGLARRSFWRACPPSSWRVKRQC